MRILFLIGWLLVPVGLSAQFPGEQDATVADEPVPDSSGFVHGYFKSRPSLRLGDFAQIDFRTKWHFDFRQFSPPVMNLPGVVNALPVTPDTFLLSKARFGLKGHVTKFIDYEFERDLRRTFEDSRDFADYHPWKDNYGNLHLHRLLQVQIGKFKLPFGLEETQPEDRLEYAFKSTVSDTLAPGRERGVMLHARFLNDNRFEYQAGVFRYDGEGSDIHGLPTAGRTYAVRLTGQPLRSIPIVPQPLRHLYLGVAATRGRMFTGLNGVNGQTFSGFTYFDHLYVNGNRTRIGMEAAWAQGPVSIEGEYIHMSEERRQEGIRGEDLPDKISRGWYVSGAWTALGKMKSRGTTPVNPFLTGHGLGAVELAARFDVLTFSSAPGPGLPTRSPRAPVILPNSDRTWTFGPTWYLNRYLKIQINAQRERLTDIERKSVAGRNEFWVGIIRLQFAM